MARPEAENDKVRLQVGLCRPVAAELEQHARELELSQSWVGSWAVRCTLDDIPAFVAWIGKRLTNSASNQKWKPTTETEGEMRLQLRLERETAMRLELAATALNQSPVKLAGLMIEHTLDDSKLALVMLKTRGGKLLRKMFRGKEDQAFEAAECDTATAAEGATRMENGDERTAA